MVVVGGGLIGCAVAREAAIRGARVTLLEPSEPAGESSRAAAGMLSPLGEAADAGPFLRLALQSLDLYPEFAAALAEESGLDVGYRRGGRTLVALDDAEREELARRLRWQSAEGLAVRWLDPDELRESEPAIAQGAVAALRLPCDAWVDVRTLGPASWRAAARRGVRLLPGQAATEVRASRGVVQGVGLRGGGTLHAGRVVVAAGAWSGLLSGLPGPVPVRPVRGQMIALAWRPGALRGIVSGGGVYVLPRTAEGDSRVWVGATVEEAGFEKRTTAAARDALRRGAARLIPELGGSRVVEHWAGLRPGTPDGLPILGADPEVEGVLYATGHFRNGILLAPATAHLLGRALEGERPAQLRPFGPARFAAP